MVKACITEEALLDVVTNPTPTPNPTLYLPTQAYPCTPTLSRLKLPLIPCPSPKGTPPSPPQSGPSSPTPQMRPTHQ